MARSLSSVSVVDALADDIRRRVFASDLASGTALTEAAIAEDYSVARSTAKAAIEKLTGEGLLHRGAHRSARVPALTAADVHDVYRTRLRLESVALRDLAADRRVPAAARQANERVRRTGEGPSLDSVEHDMAFHAALVGALDSPRLDRMYGSLVDEVRLCMAQVQGRGLLAVEQIADEHARLLDLLEAGEGEAAVELLGEHLTGAAGRLASALGAESRPPVV